jgi:hypothetical protein
MTDVIYRKPMPYTVDALKLMRGGASAQDLGWDEQRYLGVCRKHGIEPVAAPLPQAPNAPPEKCPAALVAYLSEPWKPGTRRLLCIEWSIACQRKPMRRTQPVNYAVAMMAAALCTGDKVRAPLFAEAIGVPEGDNMPSKRSWNHAAIALRQFPLATPFDIASSRGGAGGYQLVYSGTADPAWFKIVSLGDIRFDGA